MLSPETNRSAARHNIRSFDGKTPHIGNQVWVDATALVIGDVHLGDQASLWPMVVVRGDVNSIRIGARTNIQDGSVLHVTHDSHYVPGGNPLVIGEEVTVGHKVILHGCSVGRNCLIGMGSVVMDGAVLQPGLILGAGSLVTNGKALEGGYLWMGSPARRIRPLSEEERERLSYTPAHYIRLAEEHRGVEKPNG
jgi:carbonic anhydrase/acetyltransferase-like protein (isoleucine patch superfamily)